MSPTIRIGERPVGAGQPVFVIAELSANHGQDIEQAFALVRAAKEAGADAVKLQTYTPDSMTIDCDNELFRISGTLWSGKTLYELYAEAYTPWEWHGPLAELARELGIALFSTPFDVSAVDFLEQHDPPAYKIASFELVDLALIERAAATGKPLIVSTGLGTVAEIDEAVRAVRRAGGSELALLKCTSAYPAPPEEMNLRAIPHLAEIFGAVAGLSDHTLGTAVAVAAVTLGASIVEKHFTLSRAIEGPDSPFSLEPHEFAEMVRAIREAEAALGTGEVEVAPSEEQSRVFRRSLFFVRDLREGEILDESAVRSIRPGYGLAPRHLVNVLGREAARDIERGTPVSWDLVRPVAART